MSRTVTLPSVTTGNINVYPNYGFTLIIADEAGLGSSLNIIVTPASGEKINGSTSSYTINTNYGIVKLLSIPGGWLATAAL